MSINANFKIEHNLCKNGYLKSLLNYNVVSAIDINYFKSIDNFMQSLSNNINRDFKQKNYYNNMAIINIIDHIDDYYKINHSTEFRQGGK
jgi:hypothetical protein